MTPDPLDRAFFLHADSERFRRASREALRLLRHPETPCASVQGIEAWAAVGAGGLFSVSFALAGDLGRLRIPSAGPLRRGDRLWEHTCFEAFLAPAVGASYHELNLSPSGEWAEYAFARYRERDTSLADSGVTPEITVSRAEGRLDLTAVLRLDRLPLLAGSRALRVALSAVVEGEGGRLSYWALRHPARRPDFHHPDAFALEVGPPDRERPDPREG
ncbi:MAG: DOMON-like domain-containing protein [Gammaproteobacteria bacterium]|nr:DOMON-like domain-containing protein [Gammaproteobacteria bacterium]